MITQTGPFARLAALLLLATLLAPLTAAAQQPRPVVATVPQHLPIIVRHIGTDEVGLKYIESLGERLRSSNRYEITLSKEQALFALHLVSTDANDQKEGEASAIAITMSLGPAGDNSYLHTWVIVVGKDRTDDMAQALVGAIDAAVEQLKRRRATS